MEKDYFSVLIQDSDSINEIDNVREMYADDENFNLCKYVADLYSECCDGIDNFTNYEPYICRGSDFVVATYEEFTLVRNMAICGCYLLYRAAYWEEERWLHDIR